MDRSYSQVVFIWELTVISGAVLHSGGVYIGTYVISGRVLQSGGVYMGTYGN